MAKQLIIKGIEKCAGCPYVTAEITADGYSRYCGRHHNYHDIDDVSIMPEWCPLEDDT